MGLQMDSTRNNLVFELGDFLMDRVRSRPEIIDIRIEEFTRYRIYAHRLWLIWISSILAPLVVSLLLFDIKATLVFASSVGGILVSLALFYESTINTSITARIGIFITGLILLAEVSLIMLKYVATFR